MRNRFCILLGLFASQLICDAKLVARRDPLDGALDATVIAIVRQPSPSLFQVEEVFLGAVAKGQSLSLPGFQLVIEDTKVFGSGGERVEPIHPETRILIFLKPAAAAERGFQTYGAWMIAGYGNCYFWTHDPNDVSSIRSMAMSAVTLRRSWEAARDLPDERNRAEALWPYLWNNNGCCYRQTEAALLKIGPVAGDYIAGQLSKMTYRQKDVFLNHCGEYGSRLLHIALLDELKKQRAAWEDLLRQRGGFATYEEVSNPGQTRSYDHRPEDAEADRADDIYDVLYQGFVGLGGFHDRSDLPFIRESALWAVKNRFKQVDDAALDTFGGMPDRESLPVIQAIWDEYSKRPFFGNELQPYSVMKALDSHRFPEAIPVMAQFVNAGFAQDLARRFLVEMTGADFGGDVKAWLEWYASHKSALGVR